MAELDMDLIIGRVLERGYSISDNAVETAVSEVGRQLAEKLDAEIHERTHPPVPGMTPDFADGYRAAIESVREWCGVSAE